MTHKHGHASLTVLVYWRSQVGSA